MDAIRISAVSYLNTKPFLYGINQSSLLEKFNINLQTDMPSSCAEKLLNDEVDLGLVPVAVIPQMKEFHIISDFCIGADGPVKTVMLYSNVPLKDIENIYLDYQSRTSVLLAKLLAKEFWRIDPEFLPAFKGFENQIEGKNAAVVIGDRAFSMNGTFPFEFDLSGEWKKHTGLPFVFATWVSNKLLPAEFINDFNKALRFGMDSLAEVEKEYQIAGIDLKEYFTRNISFILDFKKKEALNLFLKKIKLL